MLNIDLERPSPTTEARPPSPHPESAALFLDLDGTLAPIEATPDAVRADHRRTRLLRRVVERFDGRVAILSGRSIAEVDRILDGAVANVAGVHGLERRTSPSDITAVPPHPALGRVEETLACFAKGQRGLLVESKARSVALHYRGHPPAEEACIDIGRRMAAMHGLQLQEGRMVVELRTPGPDKGDSLRLFMAQAPFAGATPVMVGDDLTDEHAFEAARDLGGWSVLVGEPRPTDALYRLRDPAAVLAWLEEAAS
ncbi:MAG: trehalose-phosphatase [Caulobacter sp.]|nr:trehalose-phosphatase [Caulobacter sp.]